ETGACCVIAVISSAKKKEIRMHRTYWTGLKPRWTLHWPLILMLIVRPLHYSWSALWEATSHRRLEFGHLRHRRTRLTLTRRFAPPSHKERENNKWGCGPNRRFTPRRYHCVMKRLFVKP